MPSAKAPGSSAIDVDRKRPDEVAELHMTFGWPETPEAVGRIFLEIAPELRDVALGVFDSSSAMISTSNGTLLRRPAGYRLLAIVRDARTIPSVLEILHKRCIAAANGWGFVDRAGRVQIRSLVDLALARPTQPIFIRPVLWKGLRQDVRTWRTEGTETVDAFAPLDSAAEADCARRIAEIEKELEPRAKARRKEAIAEDVKIAVEKGASEEAAKQTAKVRYADEETIDLLASSPITLADGSIVLVRDVLFDRLKYANKRVRDPAEPGYRDGAATGKTFANLDDDHHGVWIHSFAHGGRSFHLLHDRESLTSLLEKLGPDDVASWDFAVLHSRVKGSLRALTKAAKQKFKDEDHSTPRPGIAIIIIRPQANKVIQEAVDAITKLPSIFQRGGALVEIVRDAEKPKGIIRAPGTPRMREVLGPRMLELLTEAAFWTTGRDDSGRWIQGLPPPWAVQGVLARGGIGWGHIRPLTGVVESPVLRADGTIVSEPGYDVATGLFYSPPIPIALDLPAEPTRDDAVWAVHELLEVVADFPIVDDAGRSGSEAMTTPVAVYARFSTDRQDSRSLDDRSRRCRKYVEDRGLHVVEEYRDAAESGASLDRADMQRMLAETRKGKRCRFRAVVVDDLSRLSRDLGNTFTLVFGDLRMAGIAVIDASTGMSSDRDGARLQFGASALVADMFLESVRKQTHRGLEGRALAGFWTGGRLYGYSTAAEPNPPDPEHPRKRLVIDESEAAIVRRIFAEYAYGRSVKEIARRLDADRVPPPSAGTKRGCTPGWGHSSIVAMIDNESYIGRFTWNRRRWITDPRTGARRYVERPKAEWLTREEPALAIVGRDLWGASAARRADARKAHPGFQPGSVAGPGARGAPARHLLSGLLRCECGGSIGIFGGKGESRSYACAAHKRNPTLCPNGLSVSKAKLERSILDALRQELSAPDLLERMCRRLAERFRSRSSGPGAELRDARAAVTKVEEKLRRLLDLVESGGLPASRATGERIAAAEAERDAAAGQVAAIEAQPKAADVLPSPVAVRAHIQALDRVLTTDVERGREFLRQHVGRITLTPETRLSSTWCGSRKRARARARARARRQDPW